MTAIKPSATDRKASVINLDDDIDTPASSEERTEVNGVVSPRAPR